MAKERGWRADSTGVCTRKYLLYVVGRVCVRSWNTTYLLVSVLHPLALEICVFFCVFTFFPDPC